jgi:glycosyltransferase involved in cell wall biosynthesis
VDRAQFNEGLRDVVEQELPDLFHLPRPIILCVTRVALEKNVQVFCDLDPLLPGHAHAGTKILVGDGPILKKLRATYKDKIIFTGALEGRTLALYYALADVFVFPSLLDTFGNVSRCRSCLSLATSHGFSD